jgi:hypothetical protein
MAHAKASIGTTNYAVSIAAGRHQLSADERPELGGKEVAQAGSSTSWSTSWTRWRACSRSSGIRNLKRTISEGVLQEAGNRSVEQLAEEENKLLVGLIGLRAQHA